MLSKPCQAYQTILVEYLLNPSENCLYQACKLSTHLAHAGIGPDEIIEIHLRSLESVFQQTHPLKTPGLVLQSFNFLLEVMITYGLSHHEYLEKKTQEIQEMAQKLEKVQRKNEELDRQALELKVIAQISRILMEDHFDIPEALTQVIQAMQPLFIKANLGMVLPNSRIIIKLIHDEITVIDYNAEAVQINLAYKDLTIFKKMEGSNALYQPLLQSDYNSAIWIPILNNNHEITWALVVESEDTMRMSEDMARFLGVLRDLLVTFYKRNSLVQQLSIQATIDELTGLYNYRHFSRLLELEIERALRYDRPLSLLVLDIDHFKILNDSRGHLVGDLGLKQIATIMRKNLRDCDILCRYGGDEFVVILPETNLHRAMATAERLRSKIEQEKIEFTERWNSHTEKIQLTVSIGIATLNEEPDNAYDLLKQADQALYQAKKAGRNQVYCARKAN